MRVFSIFYSTVCYCQVALDQQQLLIAQRCYAAVGDVSRVKMLADTIRIADEAAKTVGGDGKQYYKVR